MRGKELTNFIDKNYNLIEHTGFVKTYEIEGKKVDVFTILRYDNPFSIDEIIQTITLKRKEKHVNLYQLIFERLLQVYGKFK